MGVLVPEFTVYQADTLHMKYHWLFLQFNDQCTPLIIHDLFPYLQSKQDSSELGSPKTTDDIVQERGEEGRVVRRRHKTENVKQQWSQEKAMAVELEQAHKWVLTLPMLVTSLP